MTPTSQDRHAAVNAFANRVAKYVTEEGDPEWSPYRVAVEAVTVAMQDAWYEVEAIGSPAAAPTPSPDRDPRWGEQELQASAVYAELTDELRDRLDADDVAEIISTADRFPLADGRTGVPTREQIARTAYESTHGSWDAITDGLREMYLAEAEAVLALISQPRLAGVPVADPPVVGGAGTKRWFVFDPYDGCEFFATEQQALDCASDFIDGYLDDGCLDDGWEGVVAGFVTAEATQVHRLERGDDRWDEVTGGRTDIEFWCQYEMHPVAASPTVLVELPREVVERYARNHEDVFHPTDYPLVCAAARDALAEKEADR